MSASMTRREFVRCAGTGIAALPGIVRALELPPRTRPINVLFVMTDEQHYASLSVTGNRYIQTPNLDRLAREGALFENATCVTPYCSPSRASILTGLYPHRHGILLNVTPGRNEQRPLPFDAFPNTEMLLHSRGYATRHRGKWHLGDKGDFPCYESWGYASKAPSDYGRLLEERLPAAPFAADKDPGRYLGRPVVKIPAIRDAWRLFNDGTNNVGYIATIGRTVVPPDLLPESQITRQALDLLEAHAKVPFAITVSWSPPHDLWVIPEPYYSMVDRATVALPGSTDLPAWDRKGASRRLGELAGTDGIREYAAIYHGMVKYIDDQLGLLLRRLDNLDLAENTLVVFTSDHGDMVGAHGCIGKSITSFYDDLVRIPLLLRLPGRIRPGTVVKQPVSQVDVMPTLLDYLGLPVPPSLHGRSLRPLLEGQTIPWRDYAFCQRGDRLRMLRTSRYKYTFALRPPVLALYDLQADPHEDRNLAAEPAHADTVRTLHARLLEVMCADGDPLATAWPAEPL